MASSLLACLVVLFLSFYVTVLDAQTSPTKYPQSITISYELLNSPSTNPLATILYDPATLKYSLSSWKPPSLDSLKSTSREPTSAPLVRITVPSGSSTLASLHTFNNTLTQIVDLWLSPTGDGSILSASISALPPPSAKVLKELARAARRQAQAKKISKKSKNAAEELAKAQASIKVNIIAPSAGPTPKLINRKPPVVDAEGKEVPAAEQQEKSFLQKYWWVFLVVAVLAIGGGGDK